MSTQKLIDDLQEDLSESQRLLTDGCESASLYVLQKSCARLLNEFRLGIVTRSKTPEPSIGGSTPPAGQLTNLIAECSVSCGLAGDAYRVGAFTQAQGYLVKLRELLNKHPELEAGGSKRTPESTDPQQKG